jgi:hypothetical protein
MIEIKVDPTSLSIGIVTIPNEELIKGILSMPDNEYIEVLRGILATDRLTTNSIMGVFARCWKLLSRNELDPSQINALKEFIKQINKWQNEK